MYVYIYKVLGASIHETEGLLEKNIACECALAIKHGENTPTNKGCRRASREAHEGDRITNGIV